MGGHIYISGLNSPTGYKNKGGGVVFSGQQAKYGKAPKNENNFLLKLIFKTRGSTKNHFSSV